MKKIHYFNSGYTACKRCPFTVENVTDIMKNVTCKACLQSARKEYIDTYNAMKKKIEQELGFKYEDIWGERIEN